MPEHLMQRSDEPLTFENAPTVRRGGRLYVERHAAIKLAARIAAEDSSLLAKLADE